MSRAWSEDTHSSIETNAPVRILPLLNGQARLRLDELPKGCDLQAYRYHDKYDERVKVGALARKVSMQYDGTKDLLPEKKDDAQNSFWDQSVLRNEVVQADPNYNRQFTKIASQGIFNAPRGFRGSSTISPTSP